jgi:hypothetical protein
MKPDYFKAKVVVNKANGQMVVSLPKKTFTKMPRFVKIKIPSYMLNKGELL